MRFKKAAAVFISLAVGIAICEIAIRVFGLAPQVMVLEIGGGNYDIREGTYQLSMNPKEIYVPKPRSGEVNEFGYRGPLYTDPKFQSGKRVVFIGDSVMYGVRLGFEETINDLLRKKFEAAGDLQTHFFNIAVPGYNLIQQVERLKSLGLKMKPDVVVFANCYNDLEYSSLEIMNFDVLAQANPNVVLAPHAGVGDGSGRRRYHRLALNSALYRYFYFYHWKPDNSLKRLGANIGTDIAEADIEAAMKEIFELSKKHGFKVRFVMMPAQGGDLWNKHRVLYSKLGGEHVWDLTDLVYKDWKVPTDKKYYLNGDIWHYSALGNEEIAGYFFANRDKWL